MSRRLLVLWGVVMVDISFKPAVVNLLDLTRGDDQSLELTLKQGGVLVTGLTADGWKAQVRLKPTTAANFADYPVLMEFAIDTTDIADSIIRLSWDGDQIDALPKKAYWDLQQDDLTYMAGMVTPFDQVTR